MNIKFIGLIAFLTVFGTLSPASAAVVSYANSASYFAATASNTTLDFNSDTLFQATTYAKDGATFTQPAGRLFTRTPAHYSAFGLTSNYLNINNGPGGLTITFAAPVNAFALEVGSLFNWGGASTPQIDFTFASQTQSFVLPNYLYQTANTLSFVGFSSDTPFSTIIISDPTRGLVIDSFSFASPLTSAVPEPATWAMMIFGFCGLGFMTYRRKNRIAPLSAA
jgi:hypothetical protein